MLRGPWRALRLLVLLLLPLPGAPEPRSASRPWEETDEPRSPWAWPGFQRLKEQLRAAAALSKRYWTLFSRQVWPDDCDEDGEAAAGSPGKTPCPRPPFAAEQGAIRARLWSPRSRPGRRLSPQSRFARPRVPAVGAAASAEPGAQHRLAPPAAPAPLGARPRAPATRIPAPSRLARAACAASQPTLASFEGAAADSPGERPLWTAWCRLLPCRLWTQGLRADSGPSPGWALRSESWVSLCP
ncbi:hypothetical protein P7K49_037874 [Saguinus oedipus]|uniref:Uncharacterized protein n=1 Tax=Saguinus oedipus TaxID=9490 RepID=A0ABQ9TJC6_SAGOE|nr:hypothetical protein P7K49_037874 [Saguinus oedipus]